MERLIAAILFFFIQPFLLVLWIIFKLTTHGKFLFIQKRMGRNFKPFFIYKVRTMSENAEELKEKYRKLNQADGPVFKIQNDPRLTPFGKILSRTGLDEVTQLINVIRGEMSFVGPRPLPVEEAKKIPKKYRLRFSVNPGLTSLWIIRGSHNLTFRQWMDSDLEYVKDKNLFLDMYIISVTISRIFSWIIREIKLYLSPKSS